LIQTDHIICCIDEYSIISNAAFVVADVAVVCSVVSGATIGALALQSQCSPESELCCCNTTAVQSEI
jgi:hypothetical protein